MCPYGMVMLSRNITHPDRRKDVKYLNGIFSPYIKWSCESMGKGNECKNSSITWLDHALWFIMQNFDKVLSGKKL